MKMRSLNVFKAKYFFDFLIVRVLLTDPVRVLSCDAVPEPIAEIWIEEHAWMEAVASLDHLSWFSVIQVHSLEHVLSWEVVVSNVEVLVLFLFDDLLVF